MLSSTMSALDIDPAKPTLCRLMGLVHAANHEVEELKTKNETMHKLLRDAQDEMQDLRNRHFRLKQFILCDQCKEHVETTPAAHTICLCKTCSQSCQDIKQLRARNAALIGENSDWQRCYEHLQKVYKQLVDSYIDLKAKHEGHDDGAC